MKPLLVTSGEPAGVGPDLCLALVNSSEPVVVLADKEVLLQRAQVLGQLVLIDDYQLGQSDLPRPGRLSVLSIPCAAKVVPGVLSVDNSAYVIRMLTLAITLAMDGHFSGIVTAPVHKAILNDAGIDFTGHTEFFAHHCGVETVMMMLVCERMKVALLTTHLALRDVPDAITPDLLDRSLRCLHHSLQQDFAIQSPKIYLAGLNPHAGEGGYLGKEEVEVIIPSLEKLRSLGFLISGPLAADTLFSEKNIAACDVFVAMYHDQGLAVLKYVSFGQAVNVTLGLPIIRTSVDHGTALELAGTGCAEPNSLMASIALAAKMAKARRIKNDH